MSYSTRAALQILKRLGHNPMQFRTAQDLVFAAKIATSQYRARLGV